MSLLKDGWLVRPDDFDRIETAALVFPYPSGKRHLAFSGMCEPVGAEIYVDVAMKPGEMIKGSPANIRRLLRRLERARKR